MAKNDMTVMDSPPPRTLVSARSSFAKLRENAILIYGPRKAGTTLLQRLIDGGSLYVYPAELKVKHLAEASWVSKAAFLEACRRTERLLRERVAGFDHDNFERTTSQTATQAHSLRDAILLKVEAAIESSPAGDWQGWAAKEVGGDFNVILNDWKKMFPDSRLIVIARNPFFVSRSVFRDRRRRNKQLDFTETVRQIVAPWRVLRAIGRHLGREDMHVVYYEDIVADPEAEMHPIARFLGIDFVPQFTQPTLFGEPTVVRTSTFRQEAVFKDRKPYWNELSLSEAVLLSLIGGAHFLVNLTLGRMTYKNGVLRLVERGKASPASG